MSTLLSEFSRLSQTADDHYRRKEYGIAAECYRAALEKGNGAQSLYFNYAFALSQVGRDELAAEMYEKAIELGAGAMARNNLGVALRKLGRQEEARDYFIEATELDDSEPLFWRNLAISEANLKNGSAELSALELLCQCDGCTAVDWNSLGRARDKSNDVEGALVAFRNAAQRNKDAVYFFNIALMLEKQGRILDSLATCRHSLRLNDKYEMAVSMLSRLEVEMRKNAIPPPLPNLDARQIGPEDYLNPYSLLDFSSDFDALPEADEWFKKPHDWKDITGAMTKRRRILNAELELCDDGVLHWLPTVQVSSDVVHRVLAQLDDEGWHPYHWAIFRMPWLNNFLTNGDLSYFSADNYAPYPLAADFLGADPDGSDHGRFIEFLSPYFRQQWSRSLKAALDTKHFSTTRVLFASTLPLTTSDFDDALEPLRRHITRRSEAIRQLASNIDNGEKIDSRTEIANAAQEASLLNILPPHAGQPLCDDICMAYRSLSVALANNFDDHLAADAALKAAEKFNISGTLQHRISEDRDTLSSLLAKDAEAKRREQELTLKLTWKKTLLQRQRELEISPERFSWDGQSIAAAQIAAVRYGITIHYTNGVKTGSTSVVGVQSIDGKCVECDWVGEDYFGKAVQSVMGLYGLTIFSNILKSIKSGMSCRIGHLQLSGKGVQFEKGVLFTKEHLVPWKDAHAYLGSGEVRFTSKVNPKASTALPLTETWNAGLLTHVVSFMNPTPD